MSDGDYRESIHLRIHHTPDLLVRYMIHATVQKYVNNPY
jgi:hypothetical protein